MIGKIWYRLVKQYVKLTLFFHYKKVEVKFLKDLPKDKAILFLCNHQNALLDPLIIGAYSGRDSYFLTRASVFSRPIIAKLLNSIRMIPIYRMRNGRDSLQNNEVVFNKCAKLFNENEAILIFPEGTHSLKRSLRPLSKGFTRIIFQAIENYNKKDILLVPAGVNYNSPTSHGDKMSLIFGKPIYLDNYLNVEDENDRINLIKNDVSSEIKTLTTYIDEDNYEDIINELNKSNVDYTNPFIINDYIENKNNDSLPKQKDKTKLKQLLKSVMILLLIGPYLFWKKVFEPSIREDEFIGTFKFAVIAGIIPIWLILISIIIMAATSSFWALIYFSTNIILATIYVKMD